MTRKTLNIILFSIISLTLIVTAALTLPKLIADELFPVPPEIVKMIEECKQTLDLSDVDTALVLSIMRQESGFNPNAQSYAGAQGLGQIMPATWRGIVNREPRIAAISTDAWNAKANTCGTVYYIAGLLGRYADRPDKIEMALAAYNAGPGGAEPGRRPAQTVNYVRVVAGVNLPAYQDRLASSTSTENFAQPKKQMTYLEEILGAVVGQYITDKNLIDKGKVTAEDTPLEKTVKFFAKPFYVQQ